MKTSKPAIVVVWGPYPKGGGHELRLTGEQARRLEAIVNDGITPAERRRAWVKDVLKGLKEAQRWAADRDRLSEAGQARARARRGAAS